jgi:hypothetical protein
MAVKAEPSRRGRILSWLTIIPWLLTLSPVLALILGPAFGGSGWGPLLTTFAWLAASVPLVAVGSLLLVILAALRPLRSQDILGWAIRAWLLIVAGAVVWVSSVLSVGSDPVGQAFVWGMRLAALAIVAGTLAPLGLAVWRRRSQPSAADGR